MTPMPREGKHRRPSAEEMDEKLTVPLKPEEAIRGFLAVKPEEEAGEASETSE